jgi:putative acetyltransferase
MITLRMSRANDGKALFAVWDASVRATHGFVSSADLAMYAGLVRDYYLPQTPVLVAADERDAPLGFIGLNGNRIEALFVHPDRHGKGIGRMLVADAQAKSRELFVRELFVDVNEQNGGARIFYERTGFRRIGRSPLDGCGRPYPILHLVYAT